MARVPYWKTIDYIGGGYILQEKMAAILSSDETRIEDQEKWLHVDEHEKTTKHMYDPTAQTGTRTRDIDQIKELSGVHRIVHATELNGVDADELAADAVERYGDDMFK